MKTEFRLSKVGYIMMGVADLNTAVAFYRDTLGLQARAASDDLAFVEATSVSLVLSTEVGKRPGDVEVVFTVDHVEDAYRALVERGVAFLDKPHALSAEAWVANFRDPDQHLLSIYGPK